MGAAFRPDDGVDLVDDDGIDGSQHLARVRGEDQEERFRRRDQNVRGLAAHALTFGRRRVARTDGDPRHAKRVAPFLRERADRCQGFLKVLLDILGECLHRRDVEDGNPGRDRL